MIALTESTGLLEVVQSSSGSAGSAATPYGVKNWGEKLFYADHKGESSGTLIRLQIASSSESHSTAVEAPPGSASIIQEHPLIQADSDTMARTPERFLTADLAQIILTQRLNDALSTRMPSEMLYTIRRQIAVRKIQSFIRKTLLRHLSIPPKHARAEPLAFLRTKHFERLKEAAASIDWKTRSSSRLIYLGALPHILAALEAMQNEFQVLKEKACQRLLYAKDEKIETEGNEVRAVE